jgi:diaminopimelate epimerase
VINADGSEAEMCGNGIRCVAKVLWEKDPALRLPVLRIDTGAGLLSCAIEATDGRVRSVTVDMGRPRLNRGEIPVTGPTDERAVRVPVRLGDRGLSFTAVSMGNPHAVVFIDDPAADLRELAEVHGPKLEVAPLFPRRTNVEFARFTPAGDIDLVVWERGVGITLACGTGACATAVAACIEGRAKPGREIPVHLPGGTLFITVAPGDGGANEPSYSRVEMRGPAEVVFEAEVDPSRVTQRSNLLK